MDSNHVLWYDAPAIEWTQALPIGNGHLGGMVRGGEKSLVLDLNHDELWSGLPRDTTIPGAADVFKKARALALTGDLKGAQTLAESDDFHGDWSNCYLPLGTMRADLRVDGAATNYRRQLDLRNGVQTTQYTLDGKRFIYEVYASHPANLIAASILCDDTFSADISLSTRIKGTITAEGGNIFLRGECPARFTRSQGDGNGGAYTYFDEPDMRGIQFLAGLRVCADGVTEVRNNAIHVQNATMIVCYFTAETSFAGWNKHPFLQGKPFEEPVKRALESLTLEDYGEIHAMHLEDYSGFYDRVDLQIETETSNAHLPTDARLNAFLEDDTDLSLPVLLFNYGRYLAIASSRPNTQPTNLQGIWNDQIEPPWNSNYTVNINTEMNYWPVLPCAMPELAEPLIEMVRELAVAGRHTARVQYDAPGFCAHHNTDLWRFSTPVPGAAQWSFWPMAGAWLARHLYEQYLYTQDIDYLRNTAYPILAEAAKFLLHLLIADENGYLIIAPSTSPENAFCRNGERVDVDKTTTITMEITKDLFGNLLNIADALYLRDETTEAVQAALPRLLPFKIGSKGQLLEWSEEYDEPDPHHRHCSHMYALHPARLIIPARDKELAAACRKSLALRGDDGTGWSLGWKINFWARLLDGNHAWELIKMQLRPARQRKNHSYANGGGTYDNLFDAHPPFQIDGNFGMTAGVCEMLVQVYGKTIHLLPALPDAWKNGSVKGLAIPGNCRVNIVWRDGKLKSYSIIGNPSGMKVVCQGVVLV